MSRTLQIGLVEDDPTQAKIISTMIENSGMDCLHYGTELDFRRRMGPESIDLLLLDWNLPGVSGLDLLRELRQTNATLPVIFLTGNDQETDIVTGLQAGADDYIVKPARDLLVFLFQRRGKVVSRETLLSQVWRVGPNVATRSIDTYVSRLRKRLGLQGDSEWRLEGIYQHGYRLVRSSNDDPADVPEADVG